MAVKTVHVYVALLGVSDLPVYQSWGCEVSKRWVPNELQVSNKCRDSEAHVLINAGGGCVLLEALRYVIVLMCELNQRSKLGESAAAVPLEDYSVYAGSSAQDNNNKVNLSL